MKLRLVREEFTEDYTAGTLYDEVGIVCATLEDAVRDHKIPGRTAIPYGTYEVQVTWSPRFKTMLPLLLRVPNFIGIRIHAGNTHWDTEGCILVGLSSNKGVLFHSRKALEKVLALNPTQITIEALVQEQNALA